MMAFEEKAGRLKSCRDVVFCSKRKKKCCRDVTPLLTTNERMPMPDKQGDRERRPRSALVVLTLHCECLLVCVCVWLCVSILLNGNLHYDENSSMNDRER